MNDLILSTTNNHVLTITLNRLDKQNALLNDMYIKLSSLLDEAESNDDIRVVIIQGSDSCFSAGNDLNDFLNGTGSLDERGGYQFIQKLGQFKKPLIAAVAGNAVGIGTTLLLHCDMAIAATNAKFMLPFAQLGLCPEAASSYLLPKLVGRVKAFELLVLGDKFDAHTALQLGMVNQVVEPEQLLESAQLLAARLVKLPPQALQISRELIAKGCQQAVSDIMYEEILAFEKLLKTPESKAILQHLAK
ncbi:enoyl-CoA hydratase [Thalassotalea sp. LPB0316]|uniref:enoyl-CoA hydratase n=1 Tax=Thalassotalea sp. LPB0316 TaxID=2769490 RepID=UPI0018684DA0|nr:enoyl-CoA hydratase [Thalassotalea sp. LPB0316]QOL25923.1 enoyl-CoA hydratase [Thalassotalea sp. LPB0316]